MHRILLFVAGLTLAATTPLQAETQHHGTPYAGQQSRDIKSLSAQDIETLRSGGGWGLAKAAELNNMPGPKHALELRRELDLTPAQADKLTKLMQDMTARAVPLGNRLIALENSLGKAFADGDIDPKRLKIKLDEIGKVRSNLRYVHLVTHLATPDILSDAQIADYNLLRGYTE